MRLESEGCGMVHLHTVVFEGSGRSLVKHLPYYEACPACFFHMLTGIEFMSPENRRAAVQDLFRVCAGKER